MRRRIRPYSTTLEVPDYWGSAIYPRTLIEFRYEEKIATAIIITVTKIGITIIITL